MLFHVMLIIISIISINYSDQTRNRKSWKKAKRNVYIIVGSVKKPGSSYNCIILHIIRFKENHRKLGRNVSYDLNQ